MIGVRFSFFFGKNLLEMILLPMLHDGCSSTILLLFSVIIVVVAFVVHAAFVIIVRFDMRTQHHQFFSFHSIVVEANSVIINSTCSARSWLKRISYSSYCMMTSIGTIRLVEDETSYIGNDKMVDKRG